MSSDRSSRICLPTPPYQKGSASTPYCQLNRQINHILLIEGNFRSWSVTNGVSGPREPHAGTPQGPGRRGRDETGQGLQGPCPDTDPMPRQRSRWPRNPGPPRTFKQTSPTPRPPACARLAAMPPWRVLPDSRTGFGFSETRPVPKGHASNPNAIILTEPAGGDDQGIATPSSPWPTAPLSTARPA